MKTKSTNKQLAQHAIINSIIGLTIGLVCGHYTSFSPGTGLILALFVLYIDGREHGLVAGIVSSLSLLTGHVFGLGLSWCVWPAHG